jgi:NTE family protein
VFLGQLHVLRQHPQEEIIPEHIMASGALPPALPRVKIGTDISGTAASSRNTPLRHLLDNEDAIDTIVIQVDLFSARGELPRSGKSSR